ncbi:NADH:ubiquinone oxidoreductase [Naegleria gruberi]|uniref:NADH:ubiquinone oxidoreductase n=1 Tax=Naegleria gruberi TaxID=5762 RepID=D2V371_NAEGR|nr:NADH:ubiquinone oxidoreductase [Naegleria gruberi]EFC48582.1 NADH:ubiquinone oxidoreductase [Naegleria gruberi]|eukprot:XP_002681326.1 NADH:ubiquinone oxidoreductase [Naegleria gruberi strain NEG-M]
MNNSEAHQTFESSPISAEMTKHTSETPLYDMFAKNIEQFIDAVQKNQYNRPANLSNLANMFSLQMFLIFVVLMFSIFYSHPPPAWLVLLSIAGLGCGFYSMATRDPLGMFIYSLFNFIGFVYCFIYLGYDSSIAMSFILLLLNQVKSVGYVIEFGKAKLEKRQVFEANI